MIYVKTNRYYSHNSRDKAHCISEFNRIAYIELVDEPVHYRTFEEPYLRTHL